jgi:hypothetical protein
MFSNICCLFPSWIQQIWISKNLKICLPIMLSASLFFLTPQKATAFKKKEYFVEIFFPLKNNSKKNHKLKFQENIVTVIITTD